MTPAEDRRAASLPAPEVPPDAYDTGYYLEWCAGYDEWRESHGAAAAPIYGVALDRAELAAGETVVDLGTGRGELLAAAVERGAARAVGVEYSSAAVELARRTLTARRTGPRAEVLLADARAVPLADGLADVATLLDVVEHLAPAELALALAEARRILRPGGRLLVHTMPNRSIYAITYRLQRLSRPQRVRRWPADPRNEHEHRMHVNEQTVTSLRRALASAGFAPAEVELGAWVYADFVPDERARVLYHRLAARRLTARLGIADMWASGRKPA